MGKILKNSWALFTGYGILMIAHGFQGNLLGVRSVIEAFNVVSPCPPFALLYIITTSPLIAVPASLDLPGYNFSVDVNFFFFKSWKKYF